MTNLTASQVSQLNNMCAGALGSSLGTTILEIQSNFTGVTKLYALGAPVVADPDRIVVSANMKNGSYTIAAQPDVPRNITVTHATVATGTDTLGIITVTGTNILGETISEIITPEADDIASGRKAFKTITSVVGSGWTIAGGNDTIQVGVGSALGLPVVISSASQVILGTVGTGVVSPTVDYDSADISECTISTGTYNGTAKVNVFVIQ